MNRWKKVALAATTILMAATMAFSFAACGPDQPDDPNPGPGHTHVDENDDGKCDECGEDMGEDPDDPGTDPDPNDRMETINVDTPEALNAYTEQSSELYDEVLGEFYEHYQRALADTVASDSEKYALEAIAEAKLLESAVMMPTQTEGGNYAISRLAPNTIAYSLWGNDDTRYHQALVTNQLITSEDRKVMRAQWNEMRAEGEDVYVGADYNAWAREYLTEQGYTIKDSYTIGYSADPETFDVLATSQTTDSDVLVNTYDGLVEYDEMGYIQPAIAESWEVSADGLTYTFHLRDDAAWVDSQGRFVANVTADDFVAGFQHMLDAAGGLEYLVQGVVVNADEYLTGTVTDFSQVGVRAVDEHTVEYTLVQETPYFMTMLGYGVFAPLNRSYFISKGGAFGRDAFATAEASDAYKYGTTSTDILYCGPYRITQHTSTQVIEFSQNASYYNADNINLHSIVWNYYSSEDPLATYNDAKSGTIDGAGLNTNSLNQARLETTTDLYGNTGTYFELYNYTSATSTTTFSMFYNLNRYAFEDIYDGGAYSSQTVAQAELTKAAMQNVHFRRAISFAFNRQAYNAVTVGEELSLVSLRNTYTPGTFVMLSEDVTVDINGTATTFPAGTYYGEIVQAQIDADNVPIQVWNTEVEDSISGVMGSSDGFDGWYNVENAVAELETAIEELAAEGYEISADNPVQIDFIWFDASPTYAQRGQAYKQSLEANLNGCVQVNLISATQNQWYYSCYFNSYGYESNYDANDLSGWGPDYGDPKTYLDTFLPDYAGYVVKSIGLF